MTLDLRLNPASFRRHINTSTDVRTGRQVDVGYWLYDVVTKIQPISDVKLTSDACWAIMQSKWVSFVHITEDAKSGGVRNNDHSIRSRTL